MKPFTKKIVLESGREFYVSKSEGLLTSFCS